MMNLISNKHHTTGENIFKEVKETLTEYNLDWNCLQCVTIDGGENMSGTKMDGFDRANHKILRGMEKYQNQCVLTALYTNNYFVENRLI